MVLFNLRGERRKRGDGERKRVRERERERKGEREKGRERGREEERERDVYTKITIYIVLQIENIYRPGCRCYK